MVYDTENQLLIVKDLSDCLQHVTALNGKAVRDVDEVAAGVSQALANSTGNDPGALRLSASHI
ncbi:MAG: hypothetical protein DMF61_01635 [Blastocatellia bacterium AA13]|nr:MAG: hypothetical protein DMF61_01635 [Blastocatellia bacterium AA13]